MTYPERHLVRPDSTLVPSIRGSSLSKVTAIAVLATIALLAGSSGAAQESATAGTETIRGIVINRVTGEPISRALVSSSDQRLATLTDSEGHFEFVLPHVSVAENGRSVAVNRSTFLFARKPGYLAENSLRDSSPNKDLTLALVPEGVIIGKVSLPNSEAPDPVSLELYRRQVQNGLAHWVLAGGTQSRSSGEFRFADLQAGSYKVITRELLDRDPQSFDPQGQLYGYPPAYGEKAADFNSASAIQVSAGTTALVNLSVTRKAYYRVNIPVANASEAGGLNISVLAAGDREPGFSLGYSSRDHAIEGLLPDGSYTIEAFGFAGGSTAGAGSLAIAVNGGPVHGRVMTLSPSVSIPVNVNEQFTSTDNSGSITFSTGRRSVRLKGPRSYLTVLLEPADDYGRGGMPSLREPTGPGDESLVIENARPGRYWVCVTSNPPRCGRGALICSTNPSWCHPTDHRLLLRLRCGTTPPRSLVRWRASRPANNHRSMHRDSLAYRYLPRDRPRLLRTCIVSQLRRAAASTPRSGCLPMELFRPRRWRPEPIECSHLLVRRPNWSTVTLKPCGFMRRKVRW